MTAFWRKKSGGFTNAQIDIIPQAQSGGAVSKLLKLPHLIVLCPMHSGKINPNAILIPDQLFPGIK